MPTRRGFILGRARQIAWNGRPSRGQVMDPPAGASLGILVPSPRLRCLSRVPAHSRELWAWAREAYQSPPPLPDHGQAQAAMPWKTSGPVPPRAPLPRESNRLSGPSQALTVGVAAVTHASAEAETLHAHCQLLQGSARRDRGMGNVARGRTLGRSRNGQAGPAHDVGVRSRRPKGPKMAHAEGACPQETAPPGVAPDRRQFS